MSRRRKKNNREDNGFAEWGGYMAAKMAKLNEQFAKDTCKLTKKQSDIFNGVSIFVNGYTTPSAEELKLLMAAHGGIYHHYEVSSRSTRPTTHIIASNLPNVKIKQIGNVPIVKANWITDSISVGKLLDYKKYLLYSNHNRNQPIINFPVIPKPLNNEESPLIADITESTDFKDNRAEKIETVLNNFSSHQDTKDFKNPGQFKSENSKPQSSRTLTAADPRFLSEFYNNSRLHLISTLGAEYKQLVTQLREKSNGKFQGREKLKALSNTKFNVRESVIMHIDMDCFFVSVGLRQRPELRGKPVAVTHARNSQGPLNRSESNVEAEFAVLKKYFPDDQIEKVDLHASMSEIASCSYEARKCGIRNGMFLGTAKKLCPDLQTIPYDFQGYREVSTTLYKTIAAYTLDIEAVSCDEMYVDVTPVLRETAITVEQWATHIRNEIMNITACPCSAGFGANRLQARLATKKAKPAGQFYLKPLDVEEYMFEVLLADLPGVGHATVAKLNQMGLKTCGDMQMASLAQLQAELGQKVGETILLQARGIDPKPLNFEHERKSVSADVNYGIRFKDKTEALNFLQSLSAEVFSRLQDINMRAQCLTLKLLVRAPEAPVETPKFLGCGVCNAINRSTTTSSLISDSPTIYKEAKALFERANVPPMELRGVGIQLTRLEKAPPVNTALSRFLQQNVDNKENGTGEKIKNNATEDTKNRKELYVTEAQQEEVGFTDQKIAANQRTVTEDNKSNSINNEATASNKANQKESKKQSVPKTTTAKSATTSKRGRRKGKNNNDKKTVNKPANNLNKYFKRETNTSPHLPVATKDIDINVLKELPENLRKEIMKQYGLEDKIESNPQPNNAVKDHEKPPELETLTSTKVSAFDGLKWEELKPIILNWLNSESEPANIDITMLAEYFRKLAIDRKIEDLKKMLSFLHRHISKLNHCAWHEAYLTIVNTMQEGMVARYGSTLFVERHFLCIPHY